jgi:Uma2 family endonuclease
MATASTTATEPKSTETGAKPRSITAEEFLKMDLGEEAFELVEGELKPVSIGNRLHAMVCSRINRILGNYGERTGIGYALCNDFGVLVARDPDTLRGADVAFYSHGRLSEKSAAEDIPTIPPDLVVEVVSPGNTAADLLKEIYEYLNIGVGMVWIVHPVRRTLTIYRAGDAATPVVLREDDAIANLEELPGFEAKTAEFFP